MSAELNTGTTYADNAVPVPEVDTSAPVEAPQHDAASQTPQATPPSKWAGKSPEELTRMLDDQERMIGRQTAEVAEARQRVSTYENQFAQFMAQQAQQAQTAQTTNTQAPTEPAGFDWEHPDKSVDSRVDRKLRTELDGLRRQMMMETAASQAPIAKNIAKTMYPDAFKSVSDDELDRAMYGGVQAGNVLPQNLTRPEAWRMAAWLLQGEKTGYRMAPGINPVSPTATENPVGARSQSFGGEEPSALDDQSRSILRGFETDEASYTANRRTERRGR